MADIAKRSTGVRVVRGGFGDGNQIEGRAGADIDPGDALRIDTSTGDLVKAAAGSAPNARVVGLANGKAKAGHGVTALFNGEMDGFDLSALAFGADVFLSNTAGALADAAGTTSKTVGRVIAVNGDKVLKVEVR